MISDIKNVQILTAEECSNEAYHGHENISGTGLVKIFNECPAHYRYEEDDQQSHALHFGIASHAAVLEPEKFEQEFVRDLVKDELPGVLTSDAAIKSWLKERGVKGYSSKKTGELIAMVRITGEPVLILAEERQKFEAENENKTIVRAVDYDQIEQMRRVLFADPSMVELLKDAYVEMSVICDIQISVNGQESWIGVKIRPDIITQRFEVPDYKTCASMQPDKFGRDAHDKGYWLKQAFIHDVLKAAYNQVPRMGLIAQGKKSPFIHQLYWMTDAQLEVGRDQYLYALHTYKTCKETDIWPAYFNGPAELPTPDYLARRYNF